MSSCRQTALLVALMFLLLGCWPGQAGATHVNCRDTITQDTVLDSDLIDCQAGGLVIGANNVTLDLNGHTIDGDQAALCCQPAVRNNGFDGVELTNGTIQQFEPGIVFADHSDNATIHGLLIRSNYQGGLTLADSSDALIRRNTVTGNSTGIAVSGTFSNVPTGIRVEDNIVSDNGGDGMFLGRTSGTLIRNNTMSGNGRGAPGGLEISGAGNALIERNRFVDNSGSGVVIGGVAAAPITHDVVIDDNVVTGNFGGIVLRADANSNTITRNFVRENEWIGIALEFANSNLIERNAVWRNGTGDFVISSGIFIWRAAGNRILDNSVNDNQRFGVLLQETQNTRVTQNNANRNTDDGIHVDSGSGSFLTSNTVNHNGDLGIEAVRTAVVDGGGNKATGNGNPLQCLNVACK